ARVGPYVLRYLRRACRCDQDPQPGRPGWRGGMGRRPAVAVPARRGHHPGHDRRLASLAGPGAGGGRPPTGGGARGRPGRDRAGQAELTAVACLLMRERVNYLLSVEVRLQKEEMVDRLTAIMFAAFHSP